MKRRRPYSWTARGGGVSAEKRLVKRTTQQSGERSVLPLCRKEGWTHRITTSRNLSAGI